MDLRLKQININSILKAVEKKDDIQFFDGFILEDVSVNIARINNKVPTHYHKKSDEIYYIVSGIGEMKVGDDTIPIKEGDLVYIPKTKPHTLIAQEGDVVIIFITSPPFDPQNDKFNV